MDLIRPVARPIIQSPWGSRQGQAAAIPGLIAALDFTDSSALHLIDCDGAAPTTGQAVACVDSTAQGGSYAAIQTSGTLRPSFHDNDGILFDGTDDSMLAASIPDPEATGAILTDWTVAIRAKKNVLAHQEYPISWGEFSTGKMRAIYTRFSTAYLNFEAYGSGVYPAYSIGENTWFTGVIRRTGSTIDVLADGDNAPKGSGTPTLTPYIYSGIRIAAQPDGGGFYLPGNIRRIEVHDSALIGADLTALWARMAA